MSYTIDVVSIFPGYFESPLRESLLGKAIERGDVRVCLHNPRERAERGGDVDDEPFGGGPGMVMTPGPIFETVEAIRLDGRPVIGLSPAGRPFVQSEAERLAQTKGVVLVCGRYEGVDQRVTENLFDYEYSIGDYVLAGGEAAALVVIEAVTRLLPGVVGNVASVADESHTSGILEYPQYTRPQNFRGWEVPEILLSGNHAEIVRWRRREALKKTARTRPDLISKADLTDEEKRWLSSEGYI